MNNESFPPNANQDQSIFQAQSDFFRNQHDAYRNQIDALKIPNTPMSVPTSSQFGERVKLESDLNPNEISTLGHIAMLEDVLKVVPVEDANSANSSQFGEKVVIEQSRAPYAERGGWGPLKTTTFKSGIGESPSKKD